MSKRIKWTIDTARQFYLEKGYKLLEKEYINNRKPMAFETEEGYKGVVCLSNLQSGQSITLFNTSNPFTLYNIQLFIEKNTQHIKILSTEYMGNDIPLKFECECGECFERTWATMQSNLSFKCLGCTQETSSEKQRLDFDVVREYFKGRGYIVTSKTYKSNLSNLECEDENGYKINVSYGNLKKNSGSPNIFSLVSNKHNFNHNLQNFIDNNELNCKYHGEYTVDSYGHPIVTIECECGKEFDVCIYDFISLSKTRCNTCTQKTSKYEYLTEKWLNENNLDYIKEYRFEDCRYKKPLPFDFYLPKHNTCIEVDGQQHFYSGGYYHTPEVFIRDNIKNKYCEDKEIKLIRIPFWHYYDKKYITTLSSNIQ